eukprot:561129-Pleurochrysis_carterae.AAC.1
MPAAPTAADVPGGGDLALCASVVVCSLLYIVPILGAGRAIQCYRIALGARTGPRARARGGGDARAVWAGSCAGT